MQNKIINQKIKNGYIIGTIELQALKKLLKNSLITEVNYKLLKEKNSKRISYFRLKWFEKKIKESYNLKFDTFLRVKSL